MTHYRHDYAQLMHERGFRVTPQRQLILDAICQGNGHTTPEEIYERVAAIAPAVHRATVYRSLDFLCELRLVVAADVGGGRKVYEIAGEQPHHHLICRTCSTTQQVSHAVVADLIARIASDQRFVVDMDHIALFGLCEHCQSPRVLRENPQPSATGG